MSSPGIRLLLGWVSSRVRCATAAVAAEVPPLLLYRINQ